LKKLNKKISEKKYYLIAISIFLVFAIVVWGINMNNKKVENIVVLETNYGNIVIELFLEEAPLTTENFLSYVKDGFYDGLVFHRIIKNFMIQGGGFTQEMEQKETKNPIKLEINSNLKNVRGTLAMARTNDPHSATSQFFINVVDNDFLNSKTGNDGYAVFGKVIEGMDVVDKIKNVETERKSFYDDWPVENVIIEKAYVK
jgi:peptidyl-prolyl cis-trans isomerase B (cyclophilin B)